MWERAEAPKYVPQSAGTIVGNAAVILRAISANLASSNCDWCFLARGQSCPVIIQLHAIITTPLTTTKKLRVITGKQNGISRQKTRLRPLTMRISRAGTAIRAIITQPKYAKPTLVIMRNKTIHA